MNFLIVSSIALVVTIVLCWAWAAVMSLIGAPLIVSFIGGFIIGYISTGLVFVIADELGYDVF